ncbi:MAG: ABC transporter substrate-binding protein, partial [Alphaproteobacteria bacterium]
VVALPKLIKEKGYKNVGILYQDDDFGQEVLQGAEDALKKVNMKLVEKTSFKRGATDFSTQVAKLKAANVDLIVLGTIIRETVGTIAETKKLGWKVDYLGVSALYTQMIPRLGRQAMDGLMGTNQVDVPYVDSASKEVAAWVAAYKAKFNEDPDVFAVYGYSFVNLFIAAAQKAGPNLTVDTMVAALESSEFPSDMFGSPVYKFSKTNHLGNDKTKIAVIKNGKWVNMTDYIGH